MRSVSRRGTRGDKRAVACDSSSHPADYFFKNGRRIQVGDCALFKFPNDSPHLIGVIRSSPSDKEENLNLSVNKLYRPVELKLDKGILLDAEPNEVFYSFHRCEISAASLLHPCKVAFLPKGVGLSQGTSSFVCRRVFDADNRRLLWLTDQSLFDHEQQEEVDQLLSKTQSDMHATIQSGGRSPKTMNGPSPVSQLKSGSDNVQSGSPIPSQAKGRKRERVDQGSEPMKRERSLKADEGDFAQFRSESVLKFEISKFTEKGGLVDSEGVEKLVQFMQATRVEKKLELVSKSMFAGVIAATENFDCLTRFVQLKGLPVLDQWLQDIHKGKVGSGSPKDGDKSIEEFLFILLRALDKLPVNLQALQMCNIGKSVNHLRTYKNSEIQKKARSLVDTWKKRVEAEMNVVDTKPGSNQAVSWQSRPRLPEGSAQISTAKIASSKPVQAEMSSKLATSSPASVKDGEPISVVGSNPDLRSTTVRDERSSSSSNDSTLHRNLASQKESQSGLTCEKAVDLATIEGSNHKLIVKIPNRGHSPAQNASVEPVEEPTIMHSRSSSPVLSEKNAQSDPDSKEKADVKTESWESNDFKEILTGSDAGDGSPRDLKSEKLHDVSFNSINVLIESCVKYSQVNDSVSGGDDGGMNLLASVAAEEMSKSNSPSPDGKDLGNPISVIPEQEKLEETHKSFKIESKTLNLGSRINDQSDEIKDNSKTASLNVLTVDQSEQHEEKAEPKTETTKSERILSKDDKTDDVSSCLKVKEASTGVPLSASLDADSEIKADVKEACDNSSYTEHKPFLKAKADGGEGCNGPSKNFPSESVEKIGIKLEDKDAKNLVDQDTSNAQFDEGHGNKMTCDKADEKEIKESESSATKAAAETLHVNKKPKFDLNEGFISDDGKIGDPMNFEDAEYPVSARIINPMPFPVASKASSFSAPITVAAAAKGPFVPPIDLLISKREHGWKGSAATSAFRPAEPRKPLDPPPATKQSRPVLDFDLNVANESIFDDVALRNSPHEATSTSGHDFSLKKQLVPPPLGFSVGLDLDLNRFDESGDAWQGSAKYPVSESRRGFDLNDGPVLDEAYEPSLRNPHSRSNNIQSQPFFTSQTGTSSSWFPAGNAFQPFPMVATNGPTRVLGPPTGPIPFAPELYRGSAVPFPSFQYPVFPFGTGFPVSTAYADSLSNGRLGFSASSNSQLLSGPPATVASHFQRPYGNNSKWVMQGLDLNAGPANVDVESREESSPLVSRALADEQGRMFQQMAGGVLKKKENGENFRYKQQPSWQ